MTVRLGPDHLCAYCGVAVYHRIESSDESWSGGSIPKWQKTDTYEVEHCRMHDCAGRVPAVIQRPEIVKCESCHLHVYSLQGALYDDDAATGLHRCEVEAPIPKPAALPPTTATTPKRSQPLPTIAPLEAVSILDAAPTF